MRISDWSSDVCSSDLWSSFRPLPRCRARPDRLPLPSALPIRHPVSDIPKPPSVRNRHPTVQSVASAMPQQDEARGIAHDAHIPASSDRGGNADGRADRKSVAQGKSVSVRVATGGRGIIKQKKTRKQRNTKETQTNQAQ